MSNQPVSDQITSAMISLIAAQNEVIGDLLQRLADDAPPSPEILAEMRTVIDECGIKLENIKRWATAV